MINGMPVKLAVRTEHGMDCETAYFATMRKCAELAKIHRQIVSGRVDYGSAAKGQQIATEMLANAKNEEQLESSSLKLKEKTEFLMDVGEKLDNVAMDFLVTGFKAAGYDDVNAIRLAESVPLDRVDEIISISKIGSGMADFFTDKSQLGTS